MPAYRFEWQSDPARLVICEPKTRREAEHLFEQAVPDVRRTPGTWAKVYEDGEEIYGAYHQPRPEILSLQQMQEVLCA